MEDPNDEDMQRSILDLLEYNCEAFYASALDGIQAEVRMQYARQLVKPTIVFTGCNVPVAHLLYVCDLDIWAMLNGPARADLVAISNPPERLYAEDTDYRLEFFKTRKALREKRAYVMDPYGPNILVDLSAKR